MRLFSSIVGVVGAVMLWSVLALPVRRYDDQQFSDTFRVFGELDRTPVLVVCYLAACLVATVLVVRLWFGDSSTILGFALVGVAVLAVVWLVRIAADHSVIWDGVDASGRATGGYVTAQVAVGTWVGIGGAALAGLSGLLAGIRGRSGRS